MRLLICAGGTGGGVYPALAVQSALTAKVLDLDTLWVGGEGGMEESLVKRQGIRFQAIPAAGVHGVGLAVERPRVEARGCTRRQRQRAGQEEQGGAPVHDGYRAGVMPRSNQQ